MFVALVGYAILLRSAQKNSVLLPKHALIGLLRFMIATLILFKEMYHE